MRSIHFPLFILLCLPLLSACSLLFPTEAGDDLPDFDTQAPKEGESAPLFKLRDTKGNTVSLKDMIGEKPIVLQLGSHSCPVYRYRRFDMNRLHNEFKDRVNFIVVYTLEAHPKGSKSPYSDGEWVHYVNEITDVEIKQTANISQRQEQARKSIDELGLEYAPVLIDNMDNKVWNLYGKAPAAAYVIDTRGKIVLRQAWVNPDGIHEVLEQILKEPLDKP